MQIWIVEEQRQVTLLDDVTQGAYLLVDAGYRPLLDEQSKPNRCSSLAKAEAKTYEVMRPYLQRINRFATLKPLM